MLSAQQDQVIVLLLSGKTQREAAQDVGVAEETISRWMNNDAEFVATLNARRHELWQANAEKLRALAAQAIDTLGALLDSGDEALRLKAATAVLQELRNTQPAIGPTDPESVEVEWRREQRDKELMQLLATG